MDTTNETFNDFNELDDLRQQITALKNKVDQQGRLNEDLVKKAIQNKMRSVHGIIWKLAIAVILVIPLYIMMKYQEGLSWPLTIFTIVMLVGSVISDYLINRIDVSHMGDDMVETANKLVKMKRNRKIAQRIGIGVAVIWIIWICAEFYMHHLQDGVEAAWASIIPLIVGAIVGAFIGIRIFMKMQRTNDEMIDQINELTREQ